MMNNIDKQELHILFEGIRNNNKSSFDTLYEKYKRLVYGVSFTICKNNEIADEVTQNVFFKIWKLPEEKLPTTCESSWLYSISKNETINVLRKNTSYVDIDSIYNIENTDNYLSDIIDIDSYNRKISSLKEDEKQIVSLKLLSNFTFKEIGELLDIPTATAQWKYYKSMNSLKLVLANLAMIIIAFAVFIKSKLSSNKNKVQSQSSTSSENYESIDSIQKNSESSDMHVAPHIGEIDISPDTTSKYEGTSTTISNFLTPKVKIIGFSSIFLVIIIIFSIIFKKYQQKRKK